jgi:hypothetical protein
MMTLRKSLLAVSVLVLCFAGCASTEYTGVLVDYECIHGSSTYWLEFEDGAKWKVENIDHPFPIGQKVKVTCAHRQQGYLPRVKSIEIIRSSEPRQEAPTQKVTREEK